MHLAPTTPAPHHSFYRPDALPDAQPTSVKALKAPASKEMKWDWRNGAIFSRMPCPILPIHTYTHIGAYNMSTIRHEKTKLEFWAVTT